ncbi:MAG: hypothetical protein ACK2T6_08265 [Anaerolineae bacterium]|jgi:hypothetical protein
MSRKLLLLIVPLLVLGLAACQSSNQEPQEQAQSVEQAANNVEQAAVEQEQDMGEAQDAEPADEQESEVEVVVAEPLAEDEIVTESVIAPEVQDLWTLTYVMPDGTSESPIENDPTDNISLAVLQDLVAVGDLNGDGVPDRAVVLVDIADPANPNMYVAVVLDENGKPVFAGTVAVDPDRDVNAIRIEDGQIKVDVWLPNADGTGFEMVTLTYALTDGQPSESQPPEPVPVPTALPTDAPMPAPPTVTVTIKPDVGAVDEDVDVYVHAFDNPNITGLRLVVDGEVLKEWASDDPEGVPYIHNTFTFRRAAAGKYVVTAIASDKFGSEGVSLEEHYTVK